MGEVRVQRAVRLRFFILGDVVRLAGAAHLGEVQVERSYCNGWWGLLSFTEFMMHEEQNFTEYIMHAEQTVPKNGEGAPVSS